MLAFPCCKVIICLVGLILCILYNGVALIVIPDCTEAIAFYTKIVTAAHVGVEGQIQSLKSVVVYVLLVAVVISVTLLKIWFRTDIDLLCKKGSSLCNKCQRKEWEREIQKGLLILNINGSTSSEENYPPPKGNKIKNF